MKRLCLLMAVVSIVCCREAPQPQTFHVGRQEIEFVVPQEWEALDHGNQLTLRRGEDRVVLFDLGPLTPPTKTKGPPPTLSDVAETLPELHDRRREVASRVNRSVDGHTALQLETWLSLTHIDRRHLLLILNGDRVLSIRCDRCDSATSDAFESVVKTLQFKSGSRT